MLYEWKKVRKPDALHFWAKYVVGFDKLTRAMVRSWSARKRKIAYEYFKSVWLYGNDYDVELMKRPRWIPH